MKRLSSRGAVFASSTVEFAAVVLHTVAPMSHLARPPYGLYCRCPAIGDSLTPTHDASRFPQYRGIRAARTPQRDRAPHGPHRPAAAGRPHTLPARTHHGSGPAADPDGWRWRMALRDAARCVAG